MGVQRNENTPMDHHNNDHRGIVGVLAFVVAATMMMLVNGKDNTIKKAPSNSCTTVKANDIMQPANAQAHACVRVRVYLSAYLSVYHLPAQLIVYAYGVAHCLLAPLPPPFSPQLHTGVPKRRQWAYKHHFKNDHLNRADTNSNREPTCYDGFKEPVGGQMNKAGTDRTAVANDMWPTQNGYNG
ncbi:hypothetical protein BDF19DRAFT_416213 [Syncephalis fuscata]|nr:hypothetical protein BDF19DRAFT_416213 [Syncephalis fuscata]